MSQNLTLSLTKSKKLRSKEFRESFNKADLNNSLAYQIMLNRKHRNLSQKALGELIGSKQNVISRYEDTAYGNFNISTLLKIANALDVGLQVKFVPFSRLIGDANAWSPESCVVKSFDDEVADHTQNGGFNVRTIAATKITTSGTQINAKVPQTVDPYLVQVKVL